MVFLADVLRMSCGYIIQQTTPQQVYDGKYGNTWRSVVHLITIFYVSSSSFVYIDIYTIKNYIILKSPNDDEKNRRIQMKWPATIADRGLKLRVKLVKVTANGLTTIRATPVVVGYNLVQGASNRTTTQSVDRC